MKFKRHGRRKHWPLIAAAIWIYPAATSAQSISYDITDIGTPDIPGSSSFAGDVNDAGQATVNFYAPGNNEPVGYLYSGGTLTNLGTLGGPYSEAFGINNAGQAVGACETTGNTAAHAFISSGGSMTDLGALANYPNSYGFAINDAGEVVGQSNDANPLSDAFLYASGTMTALGTLSGNNGSYAEGINNAGEIVGTSYTGRNFETGVGQAFTYSDGVMTALGTFGGTSSQAIAINNAGEITGDYILPGGMYAYIYENGVVTTIGSGYGVSVNDQGQVVGNNEGVTNSGFLFSDGITTNLTSLLPANSGWRIDYPAGINDSGQIAGSGLAPDGDEDAFLMTRIFSWTSPVSGSWNTPANWSTPDSPAGQMDVLFNTGSTLAYTVSLTAASSARNLSVPSDQVTLSLGSNCLNLSGSISVGGKLTVAGSGTVTAASLAINTGGTVDLTSATLLVNFNAPASDPIATIVGYLASGFANGAWTGTGISSSAAAAANGTSPLVSLGYADGNTDSNTVVGPNQIVIKYTLAGDANLDGRVNFTDFSILIANYGKTGTDWAHGNFLYGPGTNFGDFAKMIANYGQSLPPVGSGQSADAATTDLAAPERQISPSIGQLPEPSSFAFIALGVYPMIALRKRRI